AHLVARRHDVEAGKRLRDADPPAAIPSALGRRARTVTSGRYHRAMGDSRRTRPCRRATARLAQVGDHAAARGVLAEERRAVQREYRLYRVLGRADGPPNNTDWLVVTNVVEDPANLQTPWITSVHFKKEPDGAKWDPTPCSAKF